MGSQKTKLMRGDRYGLLKAAELAAEMISQYECARDGAHQMRVESHEEAVWDDIVVVRGDRADKWQVKRLMEKLAHDDAADLILAVSTTSGAPDGSFHLAVASLVPVTQGTKELCDLSGLRALCQEARKAGLVAADFESTEGRTEAYKFVASCLPLAGADVIVATLRRLRVQELGLEETLREQAASHLREVFANAEEIVAQLHGWFLQNPDGSICVDAKLLYEEVVDRFGQRHPSRPRWIRLSRTTAKPEWESRGVVPLDDLVGRAWGNADPMRVQIATPPFKGDAASGTLCRVMLHHALNTTAEASHPREWQLHSLNLCGGTLGTAVEAPEFRCTPVPATCFHPARETVPERRLAERLSDEMNEAVWKSYVESVDRHLREDVLAVDLRPVMQALWVKWHSQFQSSSHRTSFVRAMLATSEEWKRSGFDVAVRAGRLLTENLAKATIPALAIAGAFSSRAIAVAVGPDGTIDNLQFGAVSVHLTALTAASHPDDRTPWLLSDAPGPFFSSEGGIAILGAVDASATDLYEVACADAVPFHAVDGASQNYRHTGRPYPLLTASPTLRAAMRKSLPAVQQHLVDVLRKMNDDRVRSLVQAVEATAHG
jgi:hypothetical protein